MLQACHYGLRARIDDSGHGSGVLFFFLPRNCIGPANPLRNVCLGNLVMNNIHIFVHITTDVPLAALFRTLQKRVSALCSECGIRLVDFRA